MAMKHKITNDQWQEAQKWEKSYWDKCIHNSRTIKNLGLFKTLVKKIIGFRSDPNVNYWWSKQFEEYNFIPEYLQNAVEFGCGHTTNMRLILKGRRAKHIFASDPLIRHYITYRGSPISRKWRKGEYLIDDHPLEDAPFCSNYFDLVVCINVLDHVQDVSLCMENLIRVVRPNGILIFGQDLTSEDDVRATQIQRERTGATIGHPHIFPCEKIFLPYLRDFEPIVHKVLSRQEGRSPVYHSGTFLFAGKRTSVG